MIPGAYTQMMGLHGFNTQQAAAGMAGNPFQQQQVNQGIPLSQAQHMYEKFCIKGAAQIVIKHIITENTETPKSKEHK